MPLLTIYKDAPVNSTVIPNQFIDDYMKDANDAQLKIYLYLLRMMNARQATSVSDIADKFNHTEKDVIRALKYWQKLQLLDLDYDSSKNLTGIHIRDLDSHAEMAAGQDVQAISSFIPEAVPSASPLVPNPIPVNGRKVPSALPVGNVDGVSPYEKPSYSADQLREFKDRQDTSQLLFIAESYIGKPLTPAEIKTILYFTDVLHFSDDLIDYLIQYCVDKGKKDFKYIEKVAVNWAEEGITTPKQAQETACRYDKNIYAIMHGLGKDHSPTNRELQYINRWLKEYGFSTDIIIEACDRTVLATDKHRFEYADSILTSWKHQNVHQKSDILGVDDRFRQRKKTASPAKQTNNRFNQFQQNHYDFDVLEQELLSN